MIQWDDFTTVNAGAKGAQEFICGTDISYPEEQSTRAISIVATSIAAISDDQVEVIVGVSGAPGARVEAFRADGIWASIGSVVGGQLPSSTVGAYSTAAICRSRAGGDVLAIKVGRLSANRIFCAGGNRR
ncbi:hypothetical protein [Pseudomonas cannabina]|uniref:hypothetical protein n=1 Tax=Pseudomonas cannabina TaxID=86840 RepID=UPI001CC31A39|nr:hypothetical protein [Pseudomonas cannabina]